MMKKIIHYYPMDLELTLLEVLQGIMPYLLDKEISPNIIIIVEILLLISLNHWNFLSLS